MKRFTARCSALLTLVLTILLEPLHNWYRRTWCFYEGPTDVKDLNEVIQKKFGELTENVKRNQDVLTKALDEVKKYETITGDTNKKLTELSEAGIKTQEIITELKTRVQEIEQKGARRPGEPEAEKTAGQIVIESAQYKAMIESGTFRMNKIELPRKAIVNATGQNQPLVPSDRLQGIQAPGLRRLTVRDLLPQLRTTSNLIEFARELVFSDNAGPQYDATSPDPHSEGATKPQSDITFELATSAVITIAHWLAASRQVLSDAQQLRGYIDTRLEYGLKLEEEDELLNSSGTSGELNGLVNQATAFTGGVTNATQLDTILRAFLQVSLAYYEANGIVLHPTDWANIQMLKDTTGRYLFSDPQAVTQPRLWGKPVVATPAQTLGQFLTGAFDMAAAIYDREDANVRVSDQHSDFFIRNLVAILCEERLAIVVYRPAAIVKGALTYAG